MQSPLHGCHYDFQRWSADKIRIEFQRAGFSLEKLVPPKNSAVLSSSIELLLSDSSLLRSLGEAAKRKAFSVFDIQSTVKEYTDLYDAVLGGGNGKYNLRSL